MKHRVFTKKQGAGRQRLAQALALLTCSAIVVTLLPAQAAELGDSVTPTCDEAYYAMLDYYGNLTDGSVVKSYAMNGVTTLTDYGTYSQVNNLTDGTVPSTSGDATTFRFDDDSAPDHFYFEGKTDAPFRDLPWTLTLSYTLNGVPAKAEDLAGETGVVEIKVDAVPNANAGDYAKNNETLEAMAAFNQNDILSLEAPGAQVQLVGNLRVVLFAALPGEEQHFVIRVGTDDFSFDGMTFLIVPATLSQLDDIADLRDRKSDLEENYDRLSDSLDTLLRSVEDMSDSLNATAGGLDELDEARGTISDGKDQIYSDLDTSLGDLSALTKDLEPAQEHLEQASAALTDINSDVNALSDKAVSLKSNLTDLQDDLEVLEDDLYDLSDGSGSLEDVQDDLETLGDRLDDLQASLESMNSALSSLRTQVNSLSGSDEVLVNGMTVDEIRSAEQTVTSLHNSYVAYLEGQGVPADAVTDDNFQAFLVQALMENGYSQDEAEASAASLYGLWEMMQADQEGLDDELDQADAVNSLLDRFDLTVEQMQSLVNTFAPSTQNMLDQLSGLCDALGSDGLSGSLSGVLAEASDAAEHLGYLSDDLSGAITKVKDSLSLLDQLNETVNGYIPEAQQALADSETLAADAATGLQNLNTFLSDLEALAKQSGSQLDSGTKQTLENLADTLRRAADSLSSTGNVRSAKDSIDDIIRDEWDKYTGQVNNLLNMDATAPAVSLTSEKNPAPSSIQVLIRSEEIKVTEESETETAQQTADTGTFWGRVGQMFQDFWHAITSLF